MEASNRFLCLVAAIAVLICSSPVLCQNERDIEEPAFLVVTPSRPMHLSGGRISMTCVAFGYPAPNIIWSQGTTTFQSSSDPAASTNVYATNITDPNTGLTLLVSVLELCDTDFNDTILMMDYRCTAINSLTGTGTPVLGENTAVFNITPLVYEPAALVVAPTQESFEHRGTRFASTCAAFGSPKPRVWFSSRSLEITDFSEVTGPVNVYTEELEVGGYVFIQSTLEVCGHEMDRETYSRYIADLECNTYNGVEVDEMNAIGVQTIGFTPRPFVDISSFSLTLSSKRLIIDIWFGAAFNSDTFGCFLDKISFVNPTSPANNYSPIYLGACETVPGEPTRTRIIMDNRDFVGFISAGLASPDISVALYTTPGLEASFAPPIAVLPITSTEPIPVTSFVVDTNDAAPVLQAFDVYRTSTTTTFYLHYDALVNVATLALGRIFVTNGGVELQLNAPNMQNVPGINAKTVCFEVGQTDRNVMETDGVCTAGDNCLLHFNGSGIESALGDPAEDLDASNAITSDRFWNFPTVPPVYMQLRVEYIGCGLDFPLTSGQPYHIRTAVDETVTRITCSADSTVGINPKLRLNGQMIGDDYLTRNWPEEVIFDSPGGVVTGGQIGLFTCTTYENTANISHIVHTADPYIYFLNGPEFTVQLLEDIVIDFAYSSSAVVTDTYFSIMDGNNPPPFTYTVDLAREVPYTARIVIPRALLSYTKDYYIVAASFQLPFTIFVPFPLVEISPPAIVFMPSENRVSLTCTPSNPDIPIVWTTSTNPGAVISQENVYTFNVLPADLPSLEGVSFNCVVNNPENTNTVISMASSTFRNTNDTLSMYTGMDDDRRQLQSRERLIVATRFNKPTYLECLGHIGSEVTDLYWVIIRDGEAAFSPESRVDSDYYTIRLGENFLQLILYHSNEPFRGTVRCASRTSDEQITVYIQGNEPPPMFCPGRNVDPTWGLTWIQTPVGGRDAQLCPYVPGRPTTGVAVRSCMAGGVWGTVDTSDCRSMQFNALQDLADLFFDDARFVRDQTHFIERSDELSASLRAAVTPSMVSLFPQDIQTAGSILTNFVGTLRTFMPTTVHMETAETIDGLLHGNNTNGWEQLREMGDETSVAVLTSAEDLGLYLYESLDAGISADNSITFSMNNYALNVKRFSAFFPSLTEEIFEFGERGDGYVSINIKNSLLSSTGGLISMAFRNLNNFLPRDQPDFVNRSSIVASHLVSTQIQPPPAAPFREDSLVELEFETLSTARVYDPRVVFWDGSDGTWSEEGVESTVTVLENREVKTFNVRASSNHLTAFGVAMDVNQNVFNFTIPVWVGCGVVLLACLLSMFALLCSCMCDSERKFFSVAFIVHLSFFFSLICAFVAFLAGIELALEHRLGCASTAGLLHYFFTAAFSWLFCESLLLASFWTVATKWPLLFLYLLIGWGLPAIPTAISLGLLHPHYGTTTQCWFFFDGDVTIEVVLGFLVPKIVLVGLTLLMVVLGMFLNFRYAWKNANTVQPSLRNPYSCMLWFLWLSIIFLTLLLSATWVFAMLIVNVYGLDSETLGWVFLGVSAGLGLYTFLFSVVVLIVTQKIDYDRLFAKKGAHVSDAGGTDYRTLITAGYEKRTSVIGPPGGPVVVANPVFGSPMEGESENKRVMY